MKKFVIALCTVSFLALPAIATTTDECAYDFFANAKSALNEKSPDFASVDKIKRNDKKRELSQQAILKKDKVKVEYATGGCAHYSYSFVYSKLGQTSFTSDQAFTKAIELLKATPTTKDGQQLTKTLIEALQSASTNKILRPPNSSYDMPCGDAQCNLDASSKDSLNISYSFSL